MRKMFLFILSIPLVFIGIVVYDFYINYQLINLEGRIDSDTSLLINYCEGFKIMFSQSPTERTYYFPKNVDRYLPIKKEVREAWNRILFNFERIRSLKPLVLPKRSSIINLRVWEKYTLLKKGELVYLNRSKNFEEGENGISVTISKENWGESDFRLYSLKIEAPNDIDDLLKKARK